MPTVHRLGPYRFYFFSEENDASHEPPHIHVRSGGGVASFWLSPVRTRDSRGTIPSTSSEFGASSTRIATCS